MVPSSLGFLKTGRSVSNGEGVDIGVGDGVAGNPDSCLQETGIKNKAMTSKSMIVFFKLPPEYFKSTYELYHFKP
jgi:hypothetical protein